MPTIDLGPLGAVLSPAEDGYVSRAAELEQAGYSTIWITGGPMSDLSQLADVVRGTTTATIASGIIPVVRFPSYDVITLYSSLRDTHPGRFVVGLGGAHGPDPMGTLSSYLDRLDGAVPQEARVMAALGPRMVELSRDRASGAFPVLVTPDYVAEMRSLLGADSTLAVEQLVVLEDDPATARALARNPLGFLGAVPAYQASFRRQGFSADEGADLSDRLVDGLVAWGDDDAISARLGALRASGADHVAISVVADGSVTLEQWERVAALAA